MFASRCNFLAEALLFIFAVVCTGFSHSLFFGRSYIFHLLQQQLPALIPLLRSAGGAALSDRYFFEGLCALIGMKEGLFDAIYKRFTSMKSVYPEVSELKREPEETQSLHFFLLC